MHVMKWMNICENLFTYKYAKEIVLTKIYEPIRPLHLILLLHSHDINAPFYYSIIY